MSNWQLLAGFTNESRMRFFYFKIMAVKKIFLGDCDEEIIIENCIEHTIFIQITDIKELKEPEVVCSALMDYPTAIAFRNELSRLIKIIKNNQL